MNGVASVSFHQGALINPTHREKTYNVVLFSAARTKSALLMVDASDEMHLKIIPNGYLLSKQGLHWTVEEGGGGYIDYETIANFVDSLSSKKVSRVKLIASTSGC
ncbi:hypothetical protein [Dyella monticola]|uniref:hypothetical protein n=1 Tax=Dyella monticola TaxID=1927958 RepID=UPI0011C04BB4|nr:hypothetical protein [Dyella monticola]